MIDIRYIAGFWDGDGSITIQKQKWISKNRAGVQHFLCIKVSNTDKRILEEIKSYFNVGTVMSNGKSKAKNRQAWQYQSSANDAYKIIKKLYPYLVIKKEQAELALHFQERMNKNKKRCMRYNFVTAKELAFRESIKIKISNLNKGLENCDGFEQKED